MKITHGEQYITCNVEIKHITGLEWLDNIMWIFPFKKVSEPWMAMFLQRVYSSVAKHTPYRQKINLQHLQEGMGKNTRESE